MERSSQIMDLRPVIPNAKILEGTSLEEAFQNKTLRPILKFQNELLVAIVKTRLLKIQTQYFNLTKPKKITLIERVIQKDLRDILIGTVLGHFTMNEYEVYSDNKSQINKRMIKMIVQRISTSQLIQA